VGANPTASTNFQHPEYLLNQTVRPGRVIAGLLLCAGCAGSSAMSPGAALHSPAASSPIGGFLETVVLDAGHGGEDPGAAYSGLQEKSLNLDIAARLRDALHEAGFSAVMTRDNDRFIALSARAAIANRLDADVFISIHSNANRNRQVSGAEVYFPRVSEVAAAGWPPHVSPADVSDDSGRVRHILWDLVLSRARTQSRALASAICDAMQQALQTGCQVKAARFVVLREAWMPAVLVEVGYVSNQQDAGRLGQAAYRQSAAEAIARGVAAYARALEPSA